MRSSCWKRPRSCREVGYLWRSMQVCHFFCSLPTGRWEWLQELQGAGFAQAGITAQLWTWSPLPCSEPGKSWAEPPSFSPHRWAIDISPSVIFGSHLFTLRILWLDCSNTSPSQDHLLLCSGTCPHPLPNECLAHHTAGNALFILWFAAISRISHWICNNKWINWDNETCWCHSSFSLF